MRRVHRTDRGTMAMALTSVSEDHLEPLLRPGSLGPAPSASDSTSRGWGLRMVVPNEFPRGRCPSDGVWEGARP